MVVYESDTRKNYGLNVSLINLIFLSLKGERLLRNKELIINLESLMTMAFSPLEWKRSCVSTFRQSFHKTSLTDKFADDRHIVCLNHFVYFVSVLFVEARTLQKLFWGTILSFKSPNNDIRLKIAAC